MIERSRRVILLIDYDNLQICASRDTPGRDLQLPPVVQLAQRYGTVIQARAYAEWNLSTERLAVYKAGIEPAFAPVLRTESDRSGKSLADTVMVAEGMDMLWTLSPDVLVLATSDKDLIPLVRVAKQRGAFVVVLGSDFTAIPLREMADDHVTYRQLITTVATEGGGPGRQPAALPEPPRRRSRERIGRERVSPAPGIVGSPPRPEREPASSPLAASAPSGMGGSAGAAAGEAVAPVTSGSPGESESQTGPRRRRRRGSRRRSDRFGMPGEVGSTPDGAQFGEGYAAGDDAAGDEGGADEEDDVISPTTAATDDELRLESEAPDVVQPTAGAEAESDRSDGVASAAPIGAEPPERPRRTRRRLGTPTGSASGSGSGDLSQAEPVSTAIGSESPGLPDDVPSPPYLTAEIPPQSADVLPAPPPDAGSADAPSSDAAPAAEDAEAAGGGAEEGPAATPARRPRRIASASRGRSRRV